VPLLGESDASASFAPSEARSDSSQPSMLSSLIARREQHHYTRKEQQSASEIIRECLTNLLEQDCSATAPIDPLEFWSSHLHGKWCGIAKLALEVLAVPATSSPVERVFSQAGLATGKHRNRTKHTLLNAQLMCYINDV
jgi:hypothetical protein